MAQPLQLTAEFMNVLEGYIAFIEELPGANNQGDTLHEAVELILEANRELAEKSLIGQAVIREPFTLTTP
jgi:hypothetical protein